MVPPSFLCLLLGLISVTFILPTSSETITLDLIRRPKLHPSNNPDDNISNLAESTLRRAYHIKQLHKHSSPSTPLFARSAGDFSFNLAIGTPPQEIPVFYDTGSSLVWVPCTTSYICFNCTQNNATITIYKPKRSSSKKSLKCNDEKCSWLDHPPNVMSSYPGCDPRISGSCSRPCFYYQAYGAGDTAGKAIYENLNLGGQVISKFFVGCSLISDLMPEGIAGFGRSITSLPNQLNLNKFSQCLISHSKFDDTSKSSKLILGGNSGETAGMKYTPLVKNPPMSPFDEYYYVQLDKITVGKKTVKVPINIAVPGENGNGGIIVDSGTTLTFMSPTVFEPIAEAFYNQMTSAQQQRVELITVPNRGNVLCIDVSGGLKLSFPKIVFDFHGGAMLDLPVDNYIIGGEDILCLPFVNSTVAVAQDGSGPAMIMGNYQQQNFLIEYDLENQRLGVKKQTCG